jgi:hypothetical protein
VKHALTGGGWSDTLLLWFASLVLLVAGYGIAWGLLGAAIATQHELTERISDRLLGNAILLQGRPTLEAAARELDRRALPLALDADRPTTVARFIHLTTMVAERTGAAIGQIEDDRSALLQAPGADDPGLALEPIILDVTLRGTYRALVATIRELVGSPLTMQIEVAAIERNNTAEQRQDLTAHLHVILEHVARVVPPPLSADRLSSVQAEESNVHAGSN